MAQCCGGRCEDGALPTASLDDVAKQVREEFAQQAGGAPQASDAPAPPTPAQTKKTISQQTFDDVVAENVDEFDMELEEAMRDAVEQFTSQGVDLSLLVTSVAAREADAKVKSLVAKVDQALADHPAAADDLPAHLRALAAACSTDDQERIAAGRHGAVGAAAFVCKKHGDSQDTVLAAFGLLAELLKAFHNREILPFQGAQAMLEALARFEDDADLQAAGFAALALAITKHEANKRNLKDLDVNGRLLAALHRHTGHPEALMAASKFLRIYLSDDDRRPGVQPGTFSRAREIGEDFQNGALRPLFALLDSPDTLANVKMVTSTLATLKAVAVNDHICKHVAAKGGLDTALLAFEAHITDEKVAANACMLLKAVSRNDDIKRIVGKGKGLGLLLRALDEHIASSRVAEQALQCLSVLCLRQPENCETIASLGCLQLIISTMTRHAEEAQVQRPAISTLRNMVSSWRNKELCAQILDHGAEPLIRQARAAHPVCEEVAYAALRDLGCEYHN